MGKAGNQRKGSNLLLSGPLGLYQLMEVGEVGGGMLGWLFNNACY
jgi:hypothetical protein